MSKNILWGIGAVAGLALILSIVGLVRGNQSAPGEHNVGSAEYVTNFDALELSRGASFIGSTTQLSKLKVGVSASAGDSVTKVNTGTCYIFPYAATVAASSSALVDCQASPTASGGGGANAPVALTGITANDHISLTLSTTTAGTGTSLLYVLGASASTTSGYITIRVFAPSGTVTWPVNAASGTAHYVGLSK